MRTTCCSVSAILLLIGGPVFADSILQTQGAGLQNVGTSFAVPVEFNQFDPSLGNLNSVTLSLAAGFSGTVSVENLSNMDDYVSGVIGGSVSVATAGDALEAEVFPSAMTPFHEPGPMSGFTDSATGSPQSTSLTASTASVLSLFSGPGQIYLTLDASTFPLVDGMETESVSDTANADATVQLTYNYAPAPEPGAASLTAIGLLALLPLLRVRRRFQQERTVACRRELNANRDRGRR